MRGLVIRCAPRVCGLSRKLKPRLNRRQAAALRQTSQGNMLWRTRPLQAKPLSCIAKLEGLVCAQELPQAAQHRHEGKGLARRVWQGGQDAQDAQQVVGTKRAASCMELASKKKSRQDPLCRGHPLKVFPGGGKNQAMEKCVPKKHKKKTSSKNMNRISPGKSTACVACKAGCARPGQKTAGAIRALAQESVKPAQRRHPPRQKATGIRSSPPRCSTSTRLDAMERDGFGHLGQNGCLTYRRAAYDPCCQHLLIQVVKVH